jgi:hypothetical protein
MLSLIAGFLAIRLFNYSIQKLQYRFGSVKL